MTLWKYAASLALAVLATAGAGCNGPTYTVLPNLPPPSLPTCTPPMPSEPADNYVAPPQEPIVRHPQGRTVPPGWAPAVNEIHWRYIVIHHSDTDRGNAASFDRDHRERRGWDELGYHFVITNGHGGSDGKVEIGPRWRKQKYGAHCGNTPNNEFNEFGIGICLVGNFQNRMPSANQLDSLQRLVRFLANRYGISPQNVIGHRDAPNARTDCPGKRFHPYLNTLRKRLGD